MPTPTYTLIDSVTLGSSASSVTFSSISATGKGDLVLVCNFSSTFNGQLYLHFNADYSSLYNFVVMYGDGSSAASSKKTNSSVVEYEFPRSSTSTPNLQIHQITDFAATDKHKSGLSRTNRADGGTSATAFRYASLSAINELTFQMQAGNFNSGSTFNLYQIVSE
tara:strand:- start:622 stop:1116 length:495 start_codon:yes stop_codon:yes gene_type:complete